ncbi:MAG: helix-turn-helix transcriptional regulator [Candidatus Limiplasma sp.]|nr:helix-turn-helix transcriptional regulator [Candidatus Limiplasma sp.]
MLGERVKAVRKDANLTQTQFAERLGVKQNTIAQIEIGRREPSEQLIISICREYGVAYEWLVDGIEPMHPPQSDSDIELLTRAMEGQNENKKQLLRILADMPDELLDKMMAYLESKLK